MRLDFVATNEAEFISLGAETTRPGLHPYELYQRYGLAHPGLSASGRSHDAGNSWIASRKDWRDRFGKFPTAVDNLLLLTEIKLAAAKARLTRVEVRDGKLMLTRRGDFILVGGKFPRLGTDRIEHQLAEVLELIRKI